MLNKLSSSEWQAWINQMPPQSNPGVLNVVGQVVSHPARAAVLVKKNPQGINPKILLLDVVLQSSGIPTKQPQPVHYAEVLTEDGQYTSIEILNEGNRIAEITDIPIVV